MRFLLGFLVLVREVELVPWCEDQTLVGDVSAWIHARGLLFHKYLGVAGRALRTVVVQGDPNFAVHHLWADAIYLRDPDANGVELYWDRPQPEWPRTPDGQLAMFNHPLDLAALLKETPPW